MTPMSNAEYLVGDKEINNTGLKVFSDEVCVFLDDLSKSILSFPQSRMYPDLISFAFWIRKSNIQRLKETYSARSDRIGRGLCFHIAPSNIPINFAFSLAFSLLAGNANVVRLPSANFAQIDIFIDILAKIIERYPEVSKRLSLIRYPRNSHLTADYSKVADVRMIWGGDATIKHLKTMESPPRSVDICFADRYSFAIVDAQKILSASEEQLNKLALDFYNDTYLMDQNACSAPQSIFWLNETAEAKSIFWNKVSTVVRQRYELQDATSIDKYLKFCEDSIRITSFDSFERSENLVYRAHLSHIDNTLESLRGKGGYFYEYSLNSLNELTAVITDRFQTITYFGIDPEVLRHFIVNNSIRGVDRIVPVGKAMDIDVIWDGHDLIIELSRKITIS